MVFVVFIPSKFSVGPDSLTGEKLIDQYEVELMRDLDPSEYHSKNYCKKHDRRYFGDGDCPECSIRIIEEEAEEGGLFECPYCHQKKPRSDFSPLGVCQRCDDFAHREDGSGGFL